MVCIFYPKFLMIRWHDSNLGHLPQNTCNFARNWRTPWPQHCRVRANAGGFFGDQIFDAKILQKSIENGKMIMG